mgnify:CR=1 FL=1
MKKVFIAVALVATMGIALVSCDPDENKCWKVEYDMEVLGLKTSVTTYQWCSKNNLDAQIASWEKLGYTNIKTSAQSKYKTIDDCLAQNLTE